MAVPEGAADALLAALQQCRRGYNLADRCVYAAYQAFIDAAVNPQVRRPPICSEELHYLLMHIFCERLQASLR